MLTTILVLLIVLWLLGMVSSYTLGGFIHILLVLAIAVVLIRVIQGRRPDLTGRLGPVRRTVRLRRLVNGARRSCPCRSCINTLHSCMVGLQICLQ